MYYRMPRFQRVRSCPSAHATCMFAELVGKNEMVGKIRGTLRSESLPQVGNIATYTSPWGIIPVSYVGLTVPVEVVSRFTATPDDLPHVPASIAEWDDLAMKLVLTFGSTGDSQYFAGNADAAADNLNLTKSIKKDSGTTDTDTTTDEPIAGAVDPHTMGPMGIRRWLAIDHFLRSSSKLDLSKTISSPQYSTDTTVQDAIFTDDMDIDVPLSASGPAYVMFIVLRYDTDPVTGFFTSSTKENANETLSDADRRKIHSMLVTGDQLGIRAHIADKTSSLGDAIRTYLFAGDLSVEPITDAANPVVGPLFSDNNIIRKNTLLTAMQYELTLSTPYNFAPDLL